MKRKEYLLTTLSVHLDKNSFFLAENSRISLFPQETDINRVAHTVVGATENIKDANEEIREVCIMMAKCDRTNEFPYRISQSFCVAQYDCFVRSLYF